MRDKVLDIRKKQPRIGGRKLIYLLQNTFKENGIKIGRDNFFKFLKEEFLLVKRKKNRTITTRTYKRFKKYGNIIMNKNITKPEQVWVSDITYLNCKNGPLYLSLITDAYSKLIIGYNVANHLKTESNMIALDMALKNRIYKKRKLIHHSDRGFQYTSNIYTEKLMNEKIEISMTTKYDPYENAIAERVNGILKDEFSISDYRIHKNEMNKMVKDAIFIYNNQRPHWSNDLLTPQQAHLYAKHQMKKYKKNYKKNIDLNL